MTHRRWKNCQKLYLEPWETTISLAVDHDQAPVLLAEAKWRLLDYEKQFSANNSDSLLMQVNAKAGISPVQVDADLFKLIAIGKYYSLHSDVSLNIAIGPGLVDGRDQTFLYAVTMVDTAHNE